MKKYLNYLSLFAVTVMLYSCGPKFNGHSDKEFAESKKKVEQKLSKDEQLNLEKALRVTAEEAMTLKWEQPAKYKGQSFNTIALKIIDGLTYSGLVSHAEHFLQQTNEKKATELSHEIDSLGKLQARYAEAGKRFDQLFKKEYIRLSKTEWFGDSVPQLEVSYAYTGKQWLHGVAEISVSVFKIGVRQQVAGNTFGQAEDTCKLEPGGSIGGSLILDELAKQEPQKWKILKYPVNNPDFKSLGLRLEVHPTRFNIDGKPIIISGETVVALTEQIKKDQADLKDIKGMKGTLDELELTDAH